MANLRLYQPCPKYQNVSMLFKFRASHQLNNSPVFVSSAKNLFGFKTTIYFRINYSHKLKNFLSHFMTRSCSLHMNLYYFLILHTRGLLTSFGPHLALILVIRIIDFLFIYLFICVYLYVLTYVHYLFRHK